MCDKLEFIYWKLIDCKKCHAPMMKVDLLHLAECGMEDWFNG